LVARGRRQGIREVLGKKRIHRKEGGHRRRMEKHF
jgi:hypothetical protein